MIKVLKNIDTSQTTSTITSYNISLSYSKKEPKGYLAWDYKPFYNMRNISTDKDNGILKDLITDKLNFSLLNPVEMIPLPSYDGSVNLLITDNKNKPRLINSRFTVRANNLYERVDRTGDNDTNIYDDDKFELQTSLLKLYTKIPKITLQGVSLGGNVKVGSYTFYFTYCDADENETDIVTESGVIPIFKGISPFDIEGGLRDEQSHKLIHLTLTNIDTEYNYIKMYYIRSTSDSNENSTQSAYSILNKYPVKNNRCDILFTGLENQKQIDTLSINVLYVNINKAKALDTVLNRLFLGNVELTIPDYKNLRDLSLRIYPQYYKNKRDTLIGNVDDNYLDYSTSISNYEYYNVNNIYNYTGYAPNELYRIGIVYILKDNSLSPVFNIRGKYDIPQVGESLNKAYDYLSVYSDENKTTRKYIDNIDEASFEIIGRHNYENSKGVIVIKDNDDLSVYNLRFAIDSDTLSEIKKLAKGYFFVRLKRMPLCLGLGLMIPIEENTHLPLIPYQVGNNLKYLLEGFMNYKRELTHDYLEHTLSLAPGYNDKQGAIIFPEFEINQPYFNSLITGGEFHIEEARFNNDTNGLIRDTSNERSYYIQTLSSNNESKTYNTKLIQVSDNVKLVGIDNYGFSARAGEAEEGFRYVKPSTRGDGTTALISVTIFNGMKTISKDVYYNPGNSIESESAYNYIRGSFGPYVGVVSKTSLNFGKIVNVYIPGYNGNFKEYFYIRYNDNSEYYAISERSLLSTVEEFQKDVFRGDSYICNFTHRLNRNFNDPAAPTNDLIVNKNTWKDEFSVKDGVVDKSKFEKINLGDINAVKLGSWITFKVRSTRNLSIRSENSSYTDEFTLYGHPRTFYPKTPMSVAGIYKVPESDLLESSYVQSTNFKLFFELPDVPYYKDTFQTRIYYSDIYVTDAFVNGYRKIYANSYRDYETSYGGLNKIIALGRDLICIFEHGITKLSINLSTAISSNSEEPIFINSHNVLPENMIVISDSIGSQWKDSVIKTESYIYGVDTVSKVIWKYSSLGLLIISDFKVQLFLNRNITFEQNELQEYLGIRNVKTHYYKNKGDVMFTYYDNTGTDTERVWNLCWNEKLNRFVTFYSWIPSFSLNIRNQYFSFDRNASKYMAKLADSNSESKDSTGIVIKSNILKERENTITLTIKDIRKPKYYDYSLLKLSIIRDIYGFSEYATRYNNKIVFDYDSVRKIMKDYDLPVFYLLIEAEITFIKNLKSADKVGLKETLTIAPLTKTLAITFEDIYKASTLELLTNPNLSNWYWAHGKTGIYDVKDNIKPTHWYGKQHPFEFEFVVNVHLDKHKIFDDLEIISNSAEPESFHYEIVGDSFSFSNDKENMYIRLEATKRLYLYNHFDVEYDPDYINYKEKQRQASDTSSINDKSTLFPLYYSRLDKLNTIEDYYHLKDGLNTKDFSMLAGAEIKPASRGKEFHIWNHAKAVDLNGSNRLRGNMHYKEDKWYVLINPINLVLKNENTWLNEKIPIELGLSPIPNEILELGKIDIPEDLKDREIVSWNWNESENNEVKIKDKWVKIRIRYSGEKLAIIHSVQTLFNITTS